jgi:hypothetical protein
MVEDSMDAEQDAAIQAQPNRIVLPISKSGASRGSEYMEEGESDAAAGRVATQWPGQVK